MSTNWRKFPKSVRLSPQSIVNYFSNPSRRQTIADLADLGVKMTEEKSSIPTDGNAPLAGKTVVVTGKLNHYSRDGINDRIKLAGGKPGSSVSKKTSLVLVGESPGSKKDDAERLGIQIITEDEFRQLVGDA